jgi:hypothetical protein
MIAGPFQSKAISLVQDEIIKRLEKNDPRPGPFDVYIVWFSKTLQNWKALLSSSLPDGRYYEVTYDGDKKMTYIDIYVKLDNVCIPD